MNFLNYVLQSILLRNYSKYMSISKFALMQPYFIPYLGYWQLLNEVDLFVIANDTKYVKQSWINRNRLVINNKVTYCSLPLKNSSDFDLIFEKQISEAYDSKKEIRRISSAYGIAKQDSRYDLLWDIFACQDSRLDHFLSASLLRICEYLSIEVKTHFATDLKIPQDLRKAERIFYTSKHLGMEYYVNLPGGRSLYSKPEFAQQGITLGFIEPQLLPFENRQETAQERLSILDLILRTENSVELKKHLLGYKVD